ncbi:MAG: undecaprenyl-phosphate galactose phosphotransferase WbaP [Candidatus Aminicenantia bacterium]
MEEKNPVIKKYGEFVSVVFLLISDILSIFLSLLLAYGLRAYVLLHLHQAFKVKPVPFSNFISSFYLIAIWLILFFHDRLYTRRVVFWEEARLVLKNSTISIFILMLLTFLFRKEKLFSRAIFILMGFLSVFIILALRYLTKTFLVRFSLWKRNVLIAGAGKTGLKVARVISSTPYLGYKITGYLDDDKEKINKKIEEIEVLGKLSEVEKWLKRTGSEELIIAMPSISEEKLRGLLEKAEPVAKRINFVSKFGIFSLYNLKTENIDNFLLISMKGRLLSSSLRIIKEFYERVIALILLPAVLVLTILIAIVIKIDSPGPVFFVQKRLGKDGKKFECLKFRTMYKNSDEILRRYLESNQEAKEEWGKYKKIRGEDPRVTSVGKFLRKWSLDEIPQIYNLIKGEMSLVGPRPYLPEELEGDSSYKTIIKVKPGITGLWQVRGRNVLTFEDRVILDEFYVRNWSLWLDFVILIKTIGVILKREGAY